MPGDPTTALLTSLLGGGGRAPSGGAPANMTGMGALAAIQASPFMRGEVSQAGPIGQIAQALMPLAMAPMYERQFAQSAEQQRMESMIKAIELAKGISEVELKKLELDEKQHPEVAFVRAIKQAQAMGGAMKGAGGVGLGGAGGPKISTKVGDTTVSWGGERTGSVSPFEAAYNAFVQENGRPPTVAEATKMQQDLRAGGIGSSIERAASIFAGGMGDAARATLVGREGFNVTPRPGGGADITVRPGDTQVQNTIQQVADSEAFLSQLDLFESAVKRSPKSVGAWPHIKNTLAGAGFQFDLMRADVQRYVMGPQDPDDPVDKSSPTYKALFDANATEQDRMRAVLVFSAAKGVFGQSGHSLSDADRQYAEGLFGPRWFANPDETLASIRTVREMTLAKNAALMRNTQITIAPNGQMLIGGRPIGMLGQGAPTPTTGAQPTPTQPTTPAPPPSDAAFPQGLPFDDAVRRAEEFLLTNSARFQSLDEAAQQQEVVEFLKQHGYK